MHIIAKYSHPTAGIVYLWGNSKRQYHLGAAAKNIMTWEDASIEEVQKYIQGNGKFINLPLDS
jgi:hypothetical protein